MATCWDELGAHPDGDGWRFALYAPHAQSVYVLGIPMSRGEDGVWTAYSAEAKAGQRYWFDVQDCHGQWLRRADPMAFAIAEPWESVLFTSSYEWQSSYVARPGPMSIYEVHLGSWRPGSTMDELVEHVAALGFTHVELMPVMAHPYRASWGYQVTGYYAPNGDPDELRRLIDLFHHAGIGVLLDWVPAHFPRDWWALAQFDGTALYEHPDPQRAAHPDWGSLIFNFGDPFVRRFLLDSARFWCSEYRVDGLRVDAVSSMLYLDYSRGEGEWTPNADGGNVDLDALSLLKELTASIPLTIAEESTLWRGVTDPGGLGFSRKWNLGWMHDTLGYLAHDPIYRQYHHDQLTLPSTYLDEERWVLPLSHDEVVHGKGSLLAKLPGDRLAGLRSLLAYMWAFPGDKLIFMGTELAAEHEWSEADGLDWTHPDAGVCDLIRELNRLLPDGDFAWLHSDPSTNTIAFRRGPSFACIVNFSGITQRINLPELSGWQVVLDTASPPPSSGAIGPLSAVYMLRP